jgi:TfoX/Sxy family transcriptional regulator of competence genes
MAWVKIPPAHHPLFVAALPKDPRVETMKMFGGVAAKVNGHIFAGLFGRSTMVFLSEKDRAAALALDGASPFDPMGNGAVRSDKVMLPESVMRDPAELRGWIARAFKAASALPDKGGKAQAPAKKAAPAKKGAAVDEADPSFVPVAKALARAPGFSLMESKSRGTRGLMVDGKSFGMSTHGRFILKVGDARVAELIADRIGKPFRPSAGKVMKGWIEVTDPKADWVALAKEALVAARVGEGKARR